jgi:hypothetical protein
MHKHHAKRSTLLVLDTPSTQSASHKFPLRARSQPGSRECVADGSWCAGHCCAVISALASWIAPFEGRRGPPRPT